MKTFNVYLMRHGPVSAPPGLHGRTDVKVDVQRQTEMVGAWCTQARPVERIISSPLSRCSDLAALLSTREKLALACEPLFQELDFGDYDGLAFDDLRQHWPQLEAFWNDPARCPLPNAERLDDFSQRVLSGWEKNINEINENLLIVTHGGVIRMILAHLLGVDWRNPRWYSTLSIGNASVTHITITTGKQLYASVRSIGVPLLV
ncbi:alpha-ribazole phosphatase family protein [Vibrio sp. CAU 1672]|uniref:alpha-ribazole phosphatase family protein n=1 Tax=Vibrio sp. CAU 1672 TaxID=3032594 RepID=UPI0023DB30AE|nr:alpha-ribazole phosphatase family protein [Vibrio sp. CAU 1672]MDF2152325.1 alpha-ribazole phosphatase family protein [Vibrio sp. CAU 1672]